VTWTTSAAIDTSISETKVALTKLRTTAAGFSTDLGLLQTRSSFTQELITTLEAGAGLLVNASLEEESANLLALQTRQALGTSALSFANQSQQSVLQLFR
jgi:flagellin-like hook-associated protein FlgL